MYKNNEIIQGIKKFHQEHAAQLPWDSKTIAQGQSPKIVMLTCSDSRVVPHQVTNAQAGQLFMLRNAGNFVPAPGTGSSEEASLAYAIDVLKVELAVVCGHTHCGAVAALYGDTSSLDASIPLWLKNGGRAGDDASLLARVEHNVRSQVARIKNLPCVRKAVDQKRLEVQGWLYNIETGQFTVCDESTGTFGPMDLCEN